MARKNLMDVIAEYQRESGIDPDTQEFIEEEEQPYRSPFLTDKSLQLLRGNKPELTPSPVPSPVAQSPQPQVAPIERTNGVSAAAPTPTPIPQAQAQLPAPIDEPVVTPIPVQDTKEPVMSLSGYTVPNTTDWSRVMRAPKSSGVKIKDIQPTPSVEPQQQPTQQQTQPTERDFTKPSREAIVDNFVPNPELNAGKDDGLKLFLQTLRQNPFNLPGAVMNLVDPTGMRGYDYGASYQVPKEELERRIIAVDKSLYKIKLAAEGKSIPPEPNPALDRFKAGFNNVMTLGGYADKLDNSLVQTLLSSNPITASYAIADKTGEAQSIVLAPVISGISNLTGIPEEQVGVGVTIAAIVLGRGQIKGGAQKFVKLPQPQQVKLVQTATATRTSPFRTQQAQSQATSTRTPRQSPFRTQQGQIAATPTPTVSTPKATTPTPAPKPTPNRTARRSKLQDLVNDQSSKLRTEFDEFAKAKLGKEAARLADLNRYSPEIQRAFKEAYGIDIPKGYVIPEKTLKILSQK